MQALAEQIFHNEVYENQLSQTQPSQSIQIKNVTVTGNGGLYDFQLLIKYHYTIR